MDAGRGTSEYAAPWEKEQRDLAEFSGAFRPVNAKCTSGCASLERVCEGQATRCACVREYTRAQAAHARAHVLSMGTREAARTCIELQKEFQ